MNSLMPCNHFIIPCLLNYYLINFPWASKHPNYCNYCVSFVLQILLLPLVFPIIYISFIIAFAYNVGFNGFARNSVLGPLGACWSNPSQRCLAVLCFIPSLPIILLFTIMWGMWAVAFGPFFALYGFFVYFSNMIYQLCCCKDTSQNQT